jgi:DNA-binding protein HU-beta
MEAVAVSDKVMLVGLGSFEPRPRAAREERNLQTGETETLQIAATTILGFSTDKHFKELVSEK